MEPTDPTTPKKCGGTKCSGVRTRADFNFKDKKKGTLQSICRVCSAWNSSQHYEANKAKAKARVAKRNARVRAEHQALVAARRKDAMCGDCGGTADQAMLMFTDADGHGRRVIDVARGAGSTEVLVAALDAAVVLCPRCSAARHPALAHPDVELIDEGPTAAMLLCDAVLSVVRTCSVSVTSSDVRAALEAAGRTDAAASVNATLARLSSQGAISRVARGCFAPVERQS